MMCALRKTLSERPLERLRSTAVAWVIATAAVACFLSAPVRSQPSPAMTDANELFAKSEWDHAAAAYEKITAGETGNGLAWQNLGESLLRMRKYDEATRAFGKAVEVKFRPLVNMVNLARVEAEKGDRDGALKWIGEIVATGQGGRLRPVILGATEFSRYRDDAQFNGLIEAMAPCRAAAYRQFDFWVGDWEVHDPADKTVGRNKVSLEQDGCLIVENWVSAQGGQTGSSFNFYDVRDRKWHQVYIDNSGNAGAFPPMAGELREGRMVLMTDDKVSPVSRWTWYAVTPDRVRQMAEQSTDGQKTWVVTWDSYYVRKGAAKN